MRFFCNLVLSLATYFVVNIAYSSEESRGVTEHHQLIPGDSNSYAPYDRTFFTWEQPVLSLAKPLSLCYLNSDNPLHTDFERGLFAASKKKNNRHLTAYIPCVEQPSTLENNGQLLDYARLYVFEGFSAARDNSISFIRDTALLLAAKEELSKSEVTSLVAKIGITDAVLNVYDAGLDSYLPFLTFSTIEAGSNLVGEPAHKLISIKAFEHGLFIFERVKVFDEETSWELADIDTHSAYLELLESGAINARRASAILNKSSDLELGAAYFLENVAFALRSEFESGDFGIPILLAYSFIPESIGYIFAVVDGSSIRRDGDWLFFTETRFMSGMNEEDPNLNPATNLPKLIYKRKSKVSCDRELRLDLAQSVKATGGQDSWSDVSGSFTELDEHSKAFVKIICGSLAKASDAADILRKLDSIYRYDFYQLPRYSERASRLRFEHMLKASE